MAFFGLLRAKEWNWYRDIAIISVIGNTQQATRPIRYHFRVDEISGPIYRDVLGGPREAENHYKIPSFCSNFEDPSMFFDVTGCVGHNCTRCAIDNVKYTIWERCSQKIYDFHFLTTHNFGGKWLLHGVLTFQNVVSDISIHTANNQYVDSADIGNKWYAVETLILLPNMGIVYINSTP